MKSKLLIIVIFLALHSINVKSQNVVFPVFGTFKDSEIEMTVYEKDSTAHAVILEEVGYSYTDINGDYDIITEYHVRIKILDAEGFEEGNIKLEFYKGESISDIKAKTFYFKNDTKLIDDLKKERIFEEKINEKWTSMNFTFPNIQVGSILEYSYKKKSPYYQKFNDGWTFQSHIPKLKSTFYSKIPGFWVYNITKYSLAEESVKQNRIENKCIDLARVTANCHFLEFEERDIPAYIEEDFTTSKKNYLKRVKYELMSFKDSYGIVTNYTKNWEDADRYIFRETQFAKDLGDISLFKKSIPANILTEPDELSRAKKVFEFIKKHYSWNGKYDIWSDFNLKKAFESKVGSVVEINISLINALLSAGIDTQMTLLSTRENGFATKLHPVLTDFNYLVARITIMGKEYFLDATHNYNTFGQLPFECLNGDLRVFPKKADSFWVEFNPGLDNATNITTLSKISEDGEITSKVRLSYTNYKAMEKRKEIVELGEQKYIDKILNNASDTEISEYKLENLDNLEEPLIESFDAIVSVDTSLEDKIYIKPFLVYDFSQNPFKQENRQYPVDFGYARKLNYNMILEIPKGYKVSEVPKKRKFLLPWYGGEMTYISEFNEEKVTIKLNFTLSKSMYPKDQYSYIKIFFAELIKAQNERIILTKIN